MGTTEPLEDWKPVFEEYGPRLLLFARQQTRCLADAEDVVQEAFLRFWKLRNANPELTPGLLFSMARRAAIDLARHNERRRLRELTMAAQDPNEDAWFDVPAEDRERYRLIESSLRRLPSDQAEVLILKIWGELTFDEISQVLGVNPHTTASRYRYGLKELKNVLTAVCV